MNLSENGADNYDWNADGVYQLEVTDPVQGGSGGIANRQATELVKRTRNLHGRVQIVEANKAPLASPALTGTPIAPTPVTGTNSQQIATTAFVKAVVAALVNSSPAALDTLNELATALGNDPNFATTITNSLALKAPLASPTLTGTPTAPTPVAGTNNQQIATTAFVQALIGAIGAAPDWGAITNKPLFEGSSALNGTDIDWVSYPVRTKTLTAATTLTFSNLIVNKTITLEITGAFALTLPASVTKISGEYDGSKNNLIQLLCINAAIPEVWCVINQGI